MEIEEKQDLILALKLAGNMYVKAIKACDSNSMELSDTLKQLKESAQEYDAKIQELTKKYNQIKKNK